MRAKKEMRRVENRKALRLFSVFRSIMVNLFGSGEWPLRLPGIEHEYIRALDRLG
jgi:hypothetical protein